MHILTKCLNTVNKKFTFSVIFIILLTMALSTIYTIFQEDKNVNYELNQKGKVLIRLTELSLIDPLWNYNDFAAKMIGEALLIDNEIAYVSITDSHSKNIFEKGTIGTQSTDTLIMFKTDIKKDTQKLGAIKIGFGNQVLKEKIKKKIFDRTIESLVIVVILVLVIFIVSSIVTKPLKTLTYVTEELSKGNLEIRADNIRSKDEIGLLAASNQQVYSTMSEVVSSSINILKVSDDNYKNAVNISAQTNKIESVVDFSIMEAVSCTEKGQKEMQEGINLSTDSGIVLNDISSTIKDAIILIDKILNSSEKTNDSVKKVMSNSKEITHSLEQVTLLSQNLSEIANNLQIVASQN